MLANGNFSTVCLGIISGFIVASPVGDSNGSPFDRIVTMPPSAPPHVVNAASAAYPCPPAAISGQEPLKNFCDSTCLLVPSPRPQVYYRPSCGLHDLVIPAADAEFALTGPSISYLGANECLWRIVHEPIPCV
jgi:hypothetical protein